MKIQPIGNLQDTPSGQDCFALVVLDESDLAAAVKDSLTAQNWVERELDATVQQHFSSGRQFCQGMTVMPYPAKANSFIAAVHIRQDI